MVAATLALICLSSLPAQAVHLHMPFHLRRWLRRDRWIELKEHGQRPKPTAADKRDGFILISRDPLERIYPGSRPRPQDLVDDLHLTAARDQYEPVQVGVYAVHDLQGVTVTVSDLSDEAGHVLPASGTVVRMVRFYGASLSARHRDRFGVVPKTLEVAVPIDVPNGTLRPYWITVHVPSDQPGGTYRGTVRIAHPRGSRDLQLTVEVLPLLLQEPDILYGTLSINPLAEISHALAHPHALLLSDKIEENIRIAGADALLHQAELMLRDQRAHGMNTISPWSAKEYTLRGEEPYLSDLEVAILLYRRIGFTQPMLYQMGTLLHTNKNNRAASYTGFDPRRDMSIAHDVARYYTRRFAQEGLPGIIFLPSEEPNLGDGISLFDSPDARQRITRDLLRTIKDAGGRTGMTCTPASAKAIGELADYWIVAARRFTPDVYDEAAQAGARLAIYANAAMMGQNTYAPRFLFGYFAWANGLKGILPWTYPVQPNRFPVNASNRGEGALNVHDRFLGIDGTPIPTIQWEMSRMGIDDAKYLTTIDALAREAAHSSSPTAHEAADAAGAFLADVHSQVGNDLRNYTFEHPHTFEPVGESGWDVARFQETRARAVAVLKQLMNATRSDTVQANGQSSPP